MQDGRDALDASVLSGPGMEDGVPPDIFSVLHAGVALGASDIHLSVGSRPLVRVSGEISELAGFEVLSPESCKGLVYSALYEEQRARFEQNLELDCSVHVSGVGRFRMNVLRQRDGIEAVLRVIPSAIPSPDYLGLGEAVMRICELPRGLVLVTGPTGSGKSTTMASLIEHINQNQAKHILTIEDPIEFIYMRKRSLIRQREVGPHTHSFHEALRHALRQDPDVILIGEMRDLETIALALTAAETGHLCFATLHTLDAAQTVDRIIDVFPPQQQQQVRVQLAGCLKAVISQMLLPCLDGVGRVAARELMLATPGLSNLIREGKTHMIPQVIETGGAHGMFTMDRSLEELVRRGLVGPETAAAKAHRRLEVPAPARPRAFAQAAA